MEPGDEEASRRRRLEDRQPAGRDDGPEGFDERSALGPDDKPYGSQTGNRAGSRKATSGTRFGVEIIKPSLLRN